jgi:hypothetical protein
LFFMTESQWQRVRELFERALEDGPVNATQWLDREAGDDPQVRAEVASLLDHHTRVGAFMTRSIVESASDLLREGNVLEPGQVLGAYSVVREVGRGGMGRVYLATDSRLSRAVALKALPPELMNDPLQRERLRREARAAAALEHPGICTVYALEELDGQLFIATEFVDGHTLRDEIASGRLPSPHEVTATAREIASALAAAHARTIAHRDLKPENVMRTRDGRIKILDFGLARADGSSSDPLSVRVTRPSAVVGTPAYMAPEQLTGLPSDARADVFAFGVLLYEYASGVHPFSAPTELATVGRVLESEPTPIERIAPQIPGVVAAVVGRCLQKAPEARFASAAGIAQALDSGENAGQPAPISARWWRTHQLTIILLYVAASVVTWQIKEWLHGLATGLFIMTCIAATVGGVFRGHLVFTERVNRMALVGERHRARPVLMATDVLIALALAGDGLLLAPTEQLPAVVAFGLAIGILLANFVLEPATTAAAFGPHEAAPGTSSAGTR